jgi:uncharacterized protein (UPF0297 family)
MNDDNCIKTYVIDVDNKLSDTSVTLLPDLYGTYASGTYSEYETAYNTLTSNWTVTHRKLSANDLLPVISKDINSSVMVGTDISNQLVGYIISGDPGYISSYKDSRDKILEYDRSLIAAVILEDYLSKIKE